MAPQVQTVPSDFSATEWLAPAASFPLMVKLAMAVPLEVIPVFQAFASNVSGRSTKTAPPDAIVRSDGTGVRPFVV